jgi:hypothetical protein
MSEEILNDEVQETEKTVKSYDFPEGTIFYQYLIEKDGYKWLTGVVTDPSLADALGFLDNHYNDSELTLKNGIFYLNGYVRPDKTEAELIAEKANQIDKELEALLDATVHQRNYKNVESCVSYFNSTDDKYRAEAIAVNRWRDDLYRTAQTVLDDVKAGRIDWHDVDVNYIVSRVDPLVW